MDGIRKCPDKWYPNEAVEVNCCPCSECPILEHGHEVLEKTQCFEQANRGIIDHNFACNAQRSFCKPWYTLDEVTNPITEVTTAGIFNETDQEKKEAFKTVAFMFLGVAVVAMVIAIFVKHKIKYKHPNHQSNNNQNSNTFSQHSHLPLSDSGISEEPSLNTRLHGNELNSIQSRAETDALCTEITETTFLKSKNSTNFTEDFISDPMSSKRVDDVTKNPLKDITNTTSQNHHNVYDVIHIVNEVEKSALLSENCDLSTVIMGESSKVEEKTEQVFDPEICTKPGK